MSIINDALNKAQAEKNLREQRTQIREQFTVEHARRRPGLNWGPVFVLLVLVLITGPIVAPVFSRPFKSAPTQPLTAASALRVPEQGADLPALPGVLASTRRAQFQIEESPLMRPGSLIPPSMHLSGIVFAPRETSYCIINGQILREGDRIGDAKIKKIAPNEVLLDQGGSELRLSAAAGI